MPWRHPLVEWLPVGILGDELRDWLADGVPGRVPEGSLRLLLPLSGGSDERVAASFGLDLAIRDGRLLIAPGWPMLEGIEGRLRLDDGVLDAEVTHAESLRRGGARRPGAPGRRAPRSGGPAGR